MLNARHPMTFPSIYTVVPRRGTCRLPRLAHLGLLEDCGRRPHPIYWEAPRHRLNAMGAGVGSDQTPIYLDKSLRAA